MEPASTSQIGKVRAYYDETWLDYRFLWLNRRNLAIHFGYWDEQTRSHGQALTNLNRVLASAVGIRDGDRVLDAGCGVGGSAVWLVEHYRVRVIGITPVPSQLERARRFGEERGLTGRASFELQDYTGTTFPDGSFDVIWAMESLCHAPDKSAFFREAARLLRPGGRLGVIEYLRRSRPLPEDGEKLLHSWLSGWAIPDLLTLEEISEGCARAGFKDVQLRDITGNVRPSLRRLHRMASLSWPLELLGHGLGLRSSAQHGNARGARDQYRALQRGLWRDALMVASRG